MIKKDINEITDDILDRCAREPGRFWEMSHLVRLAINDKDGAEDIHVLRGVIEMTVEEKGLLAKYGAGWCANSKTQEIVEAGGYLKYTSLLKKEVYRKKLADKALQQKAIRDMYLWWLPLAISVAALWVSIFK